MKTEMQHDWQRWKEWLKFALWGLTVALVCFLLYRVIVKDHPTHLVPLSAEGRDKLMTVGVPHEMSDTLVRYDAFDVHFNPERGIANCAVYEFTVNELDGTAERTGEFAQDPGVRGCPEPTDYAGSGMQRGHLVPAADLKWNTGAMCQSFLMTNVCPMHKELNEGGWAKLEEKVREWTVRDSALLVFTGPVPDGNDTTRLNGKVVVPGAYYKVIMAPCVRPTRALAFIYPNGHSGGPLRKYAVSVDEVERRTGLDFFPTLPADEQERLESGVNLGAFTH